MPTGEPSLELILPPGYQATGKFRFQIPVYALAAIVAVAPLVVAWALVMRNPWIAPGGMELSVKELGQSMSILGVEVWQGETWFLIDVSDATDVYYDEDDGGRSGLFKKRGDELEFVERLPYDRSHTLLPAEDRLWLVAHDVVQFYRDGQLHQHEFDQPQEWMNTQYTPFRGKPAAVTLNFDELLGTDGKLKDGGASIRIFEWDEQQWKPLGSCPLPSKGVEQIRATLKEWQESGELDVVHVERESSEADVAYTASSLAEIRQVIDYSYDDNLKVAAVGDELHLIWAIDDALGAQHRTWRVESKPATAIDPTLNPGAPNEVIAGDVTKSTTQGMDSSNDAVDAAGWESLNFSGIEDMYYLQIIDVIDDEVMLQWLGSQDNEYIWRGIRIVAGQLETVFEFPLGDFTDYYGYYGDMFVTAGDREGVYRVYCGAENSTPAYLEIDRGVVGRQVKIGESFSALYDATAWVYWKSRILIAVLAVTFLSALAMVLSRLIRRHHSGHYRTGPFVAQPATLWQRSMAKGVDVLLCLIPTGILLAYISFVDSWSQSTAFDAYAFTIGFLEQYVDGDLIRLMLFMAVICISPLFMAFLLSLSEGLTGKTPGKWLMGIELRDTTMALCGFKRSFYRRLLMAVDGYAPFFIFGPLYAILFQNTMFLAAMPGAFVVGMVTIAVSRRHQRIGDMVTNTIVVKSRSIASASVEEVAGVAAN